MEIVIETLNNAICGIPVLSMILITGVYLSVSTHFAQIRMFPSAVKKFLNSVNNSGNKDEFGGYRALCTALAATVGTGNIAGVAGAIALGGPGTIFWMWVCAVLGMIIKCAEVTIALRYRRKNSNGEFVGGPMYIIQSAIPHQYRFLSYVYAFLGVVAAFCIGNATQINTVISGLESIATHFHYELRYIDYLIIGGILIILIITAFKQGADGIGRWAEKLVPFASITYILLCIGVIVVCHKQLPVALVAIIKGAFSPRSTTCGVISSVFVTLRIGVSRGIFTNEAGMGTASIAHASSNVRHPVEQGLMGMMEVFLDTIVICTLTALVILCSAVDIPYGIDPGITLTLNAFSVVYGDWCHILLTGLVCIFAFATVLGWGLYGMRCAQYLFGEKIWRIYVYCQACAAIAGIVLNISVVWSLAEIVNGLMVIPNLWMLIMVSPELRRMLDTNVSIKRTV